MYLLDENEKKAIFCTKVDFNDLWWINGRVWYIFRQNLIFWTLFCYWDHCEVASSIILTVFIPLVVNWIDTNTCSKQTLVGLLHCKYLQWGTISNCSYYNLLVDSHGSKEKYLQLLNYPTFEGFFFIISSAKKTFHFLFLKL